MGGGDLPMQLATFPASFPTDFACEEDCRESRKS